MLLFILAFSAALWFAIFRYRRRRLYELAARIAGPSELPFIGHALKFAGNTEDIMKTFQEFSYFAIRNNGMAKNWFGPVLYFIVVDPSDLDVILKTSLEKDDVNRFIWDFLGYATGFAPVSVWRPRRKIMVPAFSPKILDNFVKIFSKQGNILATMLSEKNQCGKFSLWPFVSSYTLDSVSETALGLKLNAQQNHDVLILKLLPQAMHLISIRSTHIWLQPKWMFRLSTVYSQYLECIKNVHRFGDDAVHAKKKELKIDDSNASDGSYDMDSYKSQTFMELLMRSSGGQKGYSDVELREECLALLVAGTDTSAASIAYTLKLLALYPDVQEKVYQELYNVFGDSDRLLVKEDLYKLQYLECVIKESLRLYPPAPIILRKIEEEIKLPSGRILPAGCGVMVSIWGAHRDPKYWGEDVEHFNPDRFMPERFTLANTCSYIPFSSGPRNCIGYQYALMSVKTALSAVLRKHRVVSDPAPSTIPPIRVKFEVMLKDVDDYEVTLESRQSPKKP